METSGSYQPLERRKVYEQIAEQLLGQIGSGRLRPGDVLPPERELTESFGVGRSSIREALRMLESRGVIEDVGNGSFAVAGYANPLGSSLQLLLSLDQATMRDIYELRRILECEAAALAAERHDDDHLAQMDAAIAEMTLGLATTGSERADLYINGDLRFHLAIADATQNRFALHMMQALRELFHRALSAVYHIPGSPATSLEQHQQILAGDPGHPLRHLEVVLELHLH